MLKNRIKKIEESLGSPRTNQKKIDSIYRFFLMGDESSLPDQAELTETRLAARKAQAHGLKNCRGLLKVFNALKEEEEITEDEKALFDYIESMENNPKKLKSRFARRHGKKANRLLGKLGLIKMIEFDFG